MITKEKIRNAIGELGLVNTEVCIHASMKSFGSEIECGISGIVDSFMESGCTILVPTFTYMFSQCPFDMHVIKRNGISNDSDFMKEQGNEEKVFSCSCKDISLAEMGVFSEYILKCANSVRGNHPLNSFSALGEQASRLVDCQTTTDVYAPFEQMYNDDGYILLMGVMLDKATIIHYSEQLAGRTLFIRWAKNEKKEIVPVSVGSCSNGFNKLYTVLKKYEKRVVVGDCVWRCYRVRDIVGVSVAKIMEEPMITHCGDVKCDRCNDAVAGGPIIESN